MTDSNSMLELLCGGDRRSIAQGERVHALVTQAPTRIGELAELASHPDRLVSMRALDVLDKLAHEHPEWLQPYRQLFVGPLAHSAMWEIRLQIVRTLPLLAWTAAERRRAVGILLENLAHPRRFVRVWSLDSLALLARGDAAVTRRVRKELAAFERSGSPALAARARRIRAREAGLPERRSARVSEPRAARQGSA